MVCTKCQNKIGRKEPLCSVYVRASTGENLTCVFCEKCFVEFTRFVAGNPPELEDKESVTEPE